MNKKETLKKQELTLNDIPRVKIVKSNDIQRVNPKEFFMDSAKVGEALLQALTDNDPEAFLEILDTYLDVNRSRTAKQGAIARSTIQAAFSKQGKANPTLRTIAKIVSTAAKEDSLRSAT